jgi:hypothetical protein
MLTTAMMELGRDSSIKASMDEWNAASETHVTSYGKFQIEQRYTLDGFGIV